LSPSNQSRRRDFAQGVLAYVFVGLRNPVHYYAGDFEQKLNIAEIHCTLRDRTGLAGGRKPPHREGQVLRYN
jgi:hypothetical protein